MFQCRRILKLLVANILIIVVKCYSIDYIAEDSEVRGEIKDESEKYTQYLIRDDNPEGYICLTDQCLRKCCPVGQGIQKVTCVKLDSFGNATFNAYAEKYNISSFHVISNGFTCNQSIHFVENPPLNISAVPYVIESENDDDFIQEYCVDYFQNVDAIGAFVCHPSKIERTFRRFFSAGNMWECWSILSKFDILSFGYEFVGLCGVFILRK